VPSRSVPPSSFMRLRTEAVHVPLAARLQTVLDMKAWIPAFAENDLTMLSVTTV